MSRLHSCICDEDDYCSYAERTMTNYERIKNMSVEEMAESLASEAFDVCACCGITYEEKRDLEKQNKKCYECLCEKGIARWLNSEVEQ